MSEPCFGFVTQHCVTQQLSVTGFYDPTHPMFAEMVMVYNPRFEFGDSTSYEWLVDFDLVRWFQWYLSQEQQVK